LKKEDVVVMEGESKGEIKQGVKECNDEKSYEGK
jgi:hypothetical protein